eukprot:TRINITY_DN498081_c0_g1_i2.p3 TRINITY_DN498081_c0_g1~~TRINITY_DN498081_c0_g1_i2.p3  ORF type:complete len:145 (+),score=39.07 TRINITY_DN498081_c0_g1_i2:1014-1448(+)
MFKDGSCNSLNYAFPFNEEFISRMNAALIEGNRMKKKSHEERKNLRIDRSKLIRSKRKMDHEEAITAYKFGILKKKIEIERMEEQLEKLLCQNDTKSTEITLKDSNDDKIRCSEFSAEEEAKSSSQLEETEEPQEEPQEDVAKI